MPSRCKRTKTVCEPRRANFWFHPCSPVIISEIESLTFIHFYFVQVRLYIYCILHYVDVSIHFREHRRMCTSYKKIVSKTESHHQSPFEVGRGVLNRCFSTKSSVLLIKKNTKLFWAMEQTVIEIVSTWLCRACAVHSHLWKRPWQYTERPACCYSKSVLSHSVVHRPRVHMCHHTEQCPSYPYDFATWNIQIGTQQSHIALKITLQSCGAITKKICVRYTWYFACSPLPERCSGLLSCHSAQYTALVDMHT